SNAQGWSVKPSLSVQPGGTGDPVNYFSVTNIGARLGLADSARFAVPAGNQFQVSARMKPGASGQQYHIGVNWFDASGNYIASSGSSPDFYPTDTTQFVTNSITVTKPANTAYMTVGVWSSDSTNNKFGDIKLTVVGDTGIA